MTSRPPDTLTMYSAPAALAASITLICCTSDFGLCAGDDEHALAASQRFSMPARSSSLGDRGPGVRAEHVLRPCPALRNDADRALAERL